MKSSTKKAIVGVSAVAVGSLLSSIAYNTITEWFSPDDCEAQPQGSCDLLRLGDEFETEDVEAILDGLTARRGESTPLIVHTCGGDIWNIARIAEAVHLHGDVDVWVPYRAMSGGCLIALAAKRIVMWPDACLGPLDPQVLVGFSGFFSAHTLERVVAEKGTGEAEEFWLASRAESSRVLNDVRALMDRYDVPSQARERLINTEHSHGYPIFFSDALTLGLSVVPAPAEIDRRGLV